jgi:hypothetical protein
MPEEQLKCKQLSAKLIGSNVVCFRLEDETLLKVYVRMARVGVAVDRKNPDGTPLYIFNSAFRIEAVTKDKTFYAPPPPAPTQSTNEKPGDKAFVR